MNKFKIIIPKRMAGERIDNAISQMLPDYSRSKISAYIKSGNMLIQDNCFMPKNIVKGNEIVSFTYLENQSNKWLAEEIPLQIVFEDDDIMIINKPAGMVVHPGAGNLQNTLANGLLFYNVNASNLDRAGIVHRLDKNTSGVMVVAKSPKAQKYLTEQLQTHSVLREYRAIVYGNIIAGGAIDKAIARDSKDRKKQSINANGKEAKTHYRVIERFANHTYIKIVLETGRMHQIRVHMSHIGYPLVGDSIYGGKLKFPKKADYELKQALKFFNRQALHSVKITLTHPINNTNISYKSSIADDMTELLNVLRLYDKA